MQHLSKEDDRIPKPGNKKLTKVYESPRRYEPDNPVLIPPEFFQDRDCRRQYQQYLASDHCQDSSVLDLTSRASFVSPEILKAGVTSGHAADIQTLKLVVAQEESLESWVDAIVSLFGGESSKLKEISISPTQELARMRRHYILYRLPNLEMIDGEAVTDLEREAFSPGVDHVNTILIKERQKKKKLDMIPNNNNQGEISYKEEEEDNKGKVVPSGPPPPPREGIEVALGNDSTPLFGFEESTKREKKQSEQDEIILSFDDENKIELKDAKEETDQELDNSKKEDDACGKMKLENPKEEEEEETRTTGEQAAAAVVQDANISCCKIDSAETDEESEKEKKITTEQKLKVSSEENPNKEKKIIVAADDCANASLCSRIDFNISKEENQKEKTQMKQGVEVSSGDVNHSCSKTHSGKNEEENTKQDIHQTEQGLEPPNSDDVNNAFQDGSETDETQPDQEVS